MSKSGTGFQDCPKKYKEAEKSKDFHATAGPRFPFSGNRNLCMLSVFSPGFCDFYIHSFPASYFLLISDFLGRPPRFPFSRFAVIAAAVIVLVFFNLCPHNGHRSQFSSCLRMTPHLFCYTIIHIYGFSSKKSSGEKLPRNFILRRMPRASLISKKKLKNGKWVKNAMQKYTMGTLYVRKKDLQAQGRKKQLFSRKSNIGNDCPVLDAFCLIWAGYSIFPCPTRKKSKKSIKRI